MKQLLLLCTVTASISGVLNAQRPDRARAWFPDGTGLEIHTETTGTTGTNSAGEIGIAWDRVNRVVIDKQNRILFAYNLEAFRGTRPGTVTIRIEPIGAETEGELLHRQGHGLAQASGQHVPTVAQTREFPSVRIGEALTLDILYNPSTGEKVYDVLRPITDPSPTPQHPVVTEVRAHEALSLQDIVININGKVTQVPASWIIGAVVRIDIPGHGAYVLALENPTDLAPSFAFQDVAHADGKTLRWTMDGDTVEITSHTNVLTQAPNGILWIYHQSHYRSEDQPKVVRLQAADTVEWVLPNRANR